MSFKGTTWTKNDHDYLYKKKNEMGHWIYYYADDKNTKNDYRNSIIDKGYHLTQLKQTSDFAKNAHALSGNKEYAKTKAGYHAYKVLEAKMTQTSIDYNKNNSAINRGKKAIQNVVNKISNFKIKDVSLNLTQISSKSLKKKLSETK